MSAEAQAFYERMLTERIENGTAVDLGDDHWLTRICWSTDRELNPQYEGVADVERWGAMIWHRRPDGSLCHGAITFDTPEVRAVLAVRAEPGKNVWQVEQWEPLTISPSVLCRFPLDGGGTCGDHGFIRAGRWVRA